MKVTWLGRIGYRAAWERQEATRDAILAGADAEELFLLEHDPVITLGRSADPGHVLVREGVDIVETSRGGDVTAHGPGQLVIYPVVRLRRGIVAHVEGIGRAIADELRASHGLDATWKRDPAGVWVGGAKIAACGVHVRRRVAIHGFALNVTDEPLALFRRIVPCGLATPVTTIAAHVASPPALEAIAERIGARIAAALA